MFIVCLKLKLKYFLSGNQITLYPFRGANLTWTKINYVFLYNTNEIKIKEKKIYIYIFNTNTKLKNKIKE